MRLRNLHAYTSYNARGVILRWDDPTYLIPPDTTVTEFIIYRAVGSPEAEYTPVGVSYNLFYEDLLSLEEITETVLMDSSAFLNKDLGVYMIPLSYQGYSTNTADLSYDKNDITVMFEGNKLSVQKFIGSRAQVILSANKEYEMLTSSFKAITIQEGDEVTCTYYRLAHDIPIKDQLFYKVSAVIDGEESELSSACSPMGYDSTSYIWREALSRNSWMLGQAGVRVLLVKRKWVGEECSCFRKLNYAHPDYSCKECFGTGILGGYSVVKEIRISPPQSEKSKKLDRIGFRDKDHFDSWTVSPVPVSEHDLLIFPDNRRFVVGSIKQHASVSYLAQYFFDIEKITSIKDIRYSLIVPDIEEARFYDKIRKPPKSLSSKPSPEKPEIDKSEIKKGKTVVFENIHY